MRHGEPAAEPGRLLGSRIDPGLSLRGRADSAEAGSRLRQRIGVGLVVCSPQRRAVETALLAFPSTAITLDERLEEQDFGELTGLTWPEAKRSHGDRARAWRSGAAAAPGGESPEELRARAVAAATAAAAANANPNADGEIVLMTHHTPIRALIASARGWPAADWRRISVPWTGLRVVRCRALGIVGDVAGVVAAR